MYPDWLTDGCAVPGKRVSGETRGTVLAVRPGGGVAAVQAHPGVWVADAGRAARLGVPIALARHTDTVGVVVTILAVHASEALVLGFTLVTHRLASFICQSRRKRNIV